ncbi:MAG: aminotransferase class I/II-fold pyridoxal phosphate-dependent enzyme, partial [Myxococcota bacterium]|nr:aminotransferase class I/II-fold pyridoxal phosphate-dependent enzyme [Myxococcota bacterium]
MFSRRTEHDPTPNALARAATALRATGATLLDLTESNPTLAGIEHDADAIVRALADPAALTYRPEPLGLPSARAAVAADWAELGVTIDPARIVLTASTSEAYSFLLATLCDSHDEILVPAPGYPLFAQLAQLAGVHVAHYPLRLERGRWVLDAAAVYDAICERTRAIVVVSPNNPTGTWLDEDCAEALAALGLPLISDEVFARYPLEGASDGRASLLAAPRETLCFALGGLSKAAALPQMKLAWIGIDGPEHLVQPALERLELLGDSFLSVCTPVQVAALALLAVVVDDSADSVSAFLRSYEHHLPDRLSWR